MTRVAAMAMWGGGREFDLLLGDASKAEQILNWKPKVTFAGLAKMMVDADLKNETDNPR